MKKLSHSRFWCCRDNHLHQVCQGCAVSFCEEQCLRLLGQDVGQQANARRRTGTASAGVFHLTAPHIFCLPFVLFCGCLTLLCFECVFDMLLLRALLPSGLKTKQTRLKVQLRSLKATQGCIKGGGDGLWACGCFRLVLKHMSTHTHTHTHMEMFSFSSADCCCVAARCVMRASSRCFGKWTTTARQRH